MNEETIVGTWKLVSFKLNETGETRMPLGKNAKGILIYNENGYMSGIISGENRPNVSSPAALGIPEKERVAISKNFIAYAGRYKIENNKIIHNVEVSFVPNLMGVSSHGSSYTIEENNLIIKSAQSRNQGKDYSIVIKWERVS